MWVGIHVWMGICACVCACVWVVFVVTLVADTDMSCCGCNVGDGVMGLQGWAINGWWWWWRKRNRWCVTLHMSETEFLNEKQDKKINKKWRVSEKTHLGGVFWFHLILSSFWCCFWLKNKMKNKLNNAAVNYPNVLTFEQGMFWLTCWWQPVNVWFQHISVCLDWLTFHWHYYPLVCAWRFKFEVLTLLRKPTLVL